MNGPQRRYVLQLVLPWLRSALSNAVRINALVFVVVVVAGLVYGLFSGMVQNGLAALNAHFEAERIEAEAKVQEATRTKMREEGETKFTQDAMRGIKEEQQRRWLYENNFFRIDEVAAIYSTVSPQKQARIREIMQSVADEETGQYIKGWIHPSEIYNKFGTSKDYLRLVTQEEHDTFWPRLTQHLQDATAQRHKPTAEPFHPTVKW